MKKIVMTGGGTAGHVTPNIALFPRLKEIGYDIHYIGSYNGIEKGLIEDQGIKYYGISSGKLRRYLDVKNLTDPAKVVKGYFEARKLLKKIKPDIVFSKGGFVAVPVVLAAKNCKIPVIIHESDITPGLANKLAIPSASKVCCNFPETLKHLPEGKAVLTGSPIRKELFSGSREKALNFTGLKGHKPVLLIMGGSTGSKFINETIRRQLPTILQTYDVIHLCGKDHLDPTLNQQNGYLQYEYISQELPDLLALADMVISRAGANAICELLALKKPNILIPLSASASRGDQILNAKSFAKQGFSYVLDEDTMTDQQLLEAIETVRKKKAQYVTAMNESKQMNPINTILELIVKTAKK
ncbi:MAG: undecaprenyldiphospho-muramoylpentapeptide beta-N-acetylglucosaminyltransferase [Eubacterium sp.]|nr:undecaprenyldiphospho-muramoylpentapeptide beta-N-acetylglucosaminyltransferase [Eubacterium sp.]